MTPEEIEELRALVGRLGANAYDKNLAVVLGAALEHIDQQAASLAEAEALTKRNVELMNGYLARTAGLEAQVIQQTGISASRMEERERLRKQIAALKEIAVGLVATSEYETENWSMRMIPWEEISVEWAEHYKNKARRQLSEEHPEAFR